MNKPFKDHMRHCVESFMIEFGVDKKPTRKDVSGWVKQAWYKVGLLTLKRTWNRIGYEQVDNEATNEITIEGMEILDDSRDPFALETASMDAGNGDDDDCTNTSTDW